MSVSKLLTREVTLVRRTMTGTNDVGRPNVIETSITVPAYWNQITSGELVAGGPVVTGEIVVFLELGTDVQPHDYIVVAKERYEVSGDAYEAINARTGKTSHLQVRAKKNVVQ